MRQAVSRENLQASAGRVPEDEGRIAMTVAAGRMTRTQGRRRRRPPGASAARLLSLAATPTFAIAALVTTIQEDGMAAMLCSTANSGSTMSGMVAMYVLMSAFHSAPWLRMIARWWSVPSRG